MNILLISLNRETEPFTAAPLGMAKVAYSLSGAGHDVRCLDLLFSDDPVSALTDAVEEHEPGVVGISLRNIESSTEFLLPAYKNYVEHIRSITDAPMVIGGPGFSVMPGQVMRFLDLGLGIAGEGEISFPMLVDTIEKGGDPRGVHNVWTYEDGRLTMPSGRRICTPEEFAPPDWSCLPVTRYDMVGVQSKRGCSFNCVYCTYPSIEGRRMRLADPDAVAGELKSVVREYGVDAFYFVDNVFNNPKAHAEAICGSLIENKVDAEWGALVTPVGFDIGLARLMKSAGCVSVEIGADSLSERSLAALGKPFGPGDVTNAVAACKEAGLMHMLFLILGGPGEDEDTLKETFGLLDGMKPDKVFAVSGVRIYPDTPIVERARAEGAVAPESDLLMPEFYITPLLGDRLYELADEFFARHPDWIHYRANGVLDTPRKSAETFTETAWSHEATDAMEKLLSAVPRLMRPIARRAVKRKAASLASSGTRKVEVADVRDAFLSETPGPFRGRMEDSLRDMGLID